MSTSDDRTDDLQAKVDQIILERVLEIGRHLVEPTYEKTEAYLKKHGGVRHWPVMSPEMMRHFKHEEVVRTWDEPVKVEVNGKPYMQGKVYVAGSGSWEDISDFAVKDEPLEIVYVEPVKWNKTIAYLNTHKKNWILMGWKGYIKKGPVLDAYTTFKHAKNVVDIGELADAVA